MINNFDTTGLLGPQINHSIRLLESLEKNNISWDGSSTGTGKTFSACAIARHLKRKFVLICPKLAIPQWKGVLESFGLTPEFAINFEKLSRGNTPYFKRISTKKYRALYGITEEMCPEVPHFMLGEFKIPKDYLVIVDESHKMKGVDSLSAGLLFCLKRQGYTMHLMSATQATTPLDMRAFGFTVGLHNGEMKEFKKFAENSGAKWVGKWGAQYFDSGDAESVRKLHTVHEYLYDFTKIGARLTRNDFGDIFPKTQVVAESYDMGVNSDKIASVYDEMEAELIKLEEKCEGYKEHVLAIITKARRHAEILKVPTIVDMVNDFNDEGRSSVIFVNYTDTIEAIVARLTKEHGSDLIGQVHGGVSFKQRQSDILDFQNDRKTFMVANLAAGGSSINLHDVLGGRPRSSIINPSYSAISVLQSAGRIDRANTKSDVYQRFLYAARTIEENICRRFHDKNSFISVLNDGTLSDADLIPTSRMFNFVKGMNI